MYVSERILEGPSLAPFFFFDVNSLGAELSNPSLFSFSFSLSFSFSFSFPFFFSFFFFFPFSP